MKPMQANRRWRRVAAVTLLALALPSGALAAQSAAEMASPTQAEVERAVRSLDNKVLSAVIVRGNTLSPEREILAALPALRIGKTVDLKALGDEIALANENDCRQLAVDLRPNDQGFFDAHIMVREIRADQVLMTVDNSGNATTGIWRSQLSYSNANIGGTGQSAAFSYATSPADPNRLKQFGAYYNIPLPQSKDNLYVTASYSDSDAGRILSTNGYSLDASGNGRSVGLHYVRHLRRTPTEKRSLDFGLDWSQYNNDINLNVFNTPIGIGTDIGTLPFSIAYRAQNLREKMLTAYSLGYVCNIATGGQNSTDQYQQYRNGTSAHYQIWRGAYQYQQRFASDWLANVAIAGQYAGGRLINPEQLGLGGARSLRGLDERELSADRGVQGSFELYTPEIAKGQRLLLFVDAGYLNNVRPDNGELGSATLASCGIGWRASFANGCRASFDYGYVVSSTLDKYKNNKRFHCMLSQVF